MSDTFGVPAALFTCAVLCLAGVIVAVLYLRAHGLLTHRGKIETLPR
jgi:hypothetical protein